MESIPARRAGPECAVHSSSCSHGGAVVFMTVRSPARCSE